MLRCCRSSAEERAGGIKLREFQHGQWGLLRESAACLPDSFVLNSCRNKLHQRCHSLLCAFRFKAKFLAARSLSSSRNPNSPSRVTQGHDLFVANVLAEIKHPPTSSPSFSLIQLGSAAFQLSPSLLLDTPSPTHTHSGAEKGAFGPNDSNRKVTLCEPTFPTNSEI